MPAAGPDSSGPDSPPAGEGTGPGSNDTFSDGPTSSPDGWTGPSSDGPATAGRPGSTASTGTASPGLTWIASGGTYSVCDIGTDPASATGSSSTGTTPPDGAHTGTGAASVSGGTIDSTPPGGTHDSSHGGSDSGTTGKDSGGKDSGGKDSTGKDSTGKDSSGTPSASGGAGTGSKLMAGTSASGVADAAADVTSSAGAVLTSGGSPAPQRSPDEAAASRGGAPSEASGWSRGRWILFSAARTRPNNAPGARWESAGPLSRFSPNGLASLQSCGTQQRR